MASDFQDLLKYYGIQIVVTIVLLNDPQANYFIECMHQTAVTILRSMVMEAQLLAGCHLILSDHEYFVDTTLAYMCHIPSMPLST